ncbi:l-lactate dehydrogenase b chain [Lynx pardinus]|uniref:L-lactate dehydrogenase b chain n=1 Tax=Lynx pardinus TaxID=191816 RepID=A0A485NVX1_LYNPA|nr:l-lactate dehydrogenase b chain [Lynx pardinus]
MDGSGRTWQLRCGCVEWSECGISLQELNPEMGTDNDSENWNAYEAIKLKGYTNWAIGLSVADLIESILENLSRIHPVSRMVKGMYGIENEVFLSLLCILNDRGLTSIMIRKLKNDEVTQPKKSRYLVGHPEGPKRPVSSDF